MPIADRDAFNAAWRRWYAKNAARKIAWQARRRRELQRWMLALKSTLVCARCGESSPVCLQFHHRDPRTKSFEVSAMVRDGRSQAAIEAEIEKCEVLCANCHLIHHWSG